MQKSSRPDLIEDLHDVGQVHLAELWGLPGGPVALVRGLGGAVETSRSHRLQQGLLPRLCLGLLQGSPTTKPAGQLAQRAGVISSL
jgi:hypothetical protein